MKKLKIIALLCFIMVFIGCSWIYNFSSEESPSLFWKGIFWKTYGNWKCTADALWKDFSWEKINYCMGMKKICEPSLLIVDISVQDNIDLGILFGAKNIVNNIPRESYVLCIRTNDWYFNIRKQNKWENPINKKDLPFIANMNIEVILKLEDKKIKAFLYNKDRGTLIDYNEFSINSFPEGYIGFYSFYMQSTNTKIKDIRIIKLK